MARLTYRDLKKELDALSEERLDDHISVYDSVDDECYEVFRIHKNDEKSHTADVLDLGHLVLHLAK